jgi:membrane protease YdiL (CAAX protease family)
MSERVFCRFCEQTFIANERERCPLCGRVGGLVDAEHATDAGVATQPNGPGVAQGAAPLDISTAESAVLAILDERSVFQRVPWSWTHVAIACAPLAAVAAASWIWPRWTAGSATVYLSVIASEICWSIVFPLWVALRSKAAVPRVHRSLGRILTEGLWAIPIILGIVILLVVLSWLLSHFLDNAGPQSRVTESLSRQNEVSLPILVFMILGVTAGPIAEEILFRGMLYSMLRQRIPAVLALASQALVFAFIHFEQTANFIYLAFVGVLLGLVYEWRKTLWTPVLVHMGWNALVFGVVLSHIIANANAPYLGLACDDFVDEPGCVIRTLVPGGAAEQAGLQIDDVIVAFDGEQVVNYQHLRDMIRSREIGARVTIQYYRSGNLQQTSAVLQPLQRER